jgi:hypothetical protein
VQSMAVAGAHPYTAVRVAGGTAATALEVAAVVRR